MDTQYILIEASALWGLLGLLLFLFLACLLISNEAAEAERKVKEREATIQLLTQQLVAYQQLTQLTATTQAHLLTSGQQFAQQLQQIGDERRHDHGQA